MSGRSGWVWTNQPCTAQTAIAGCSALASIGAPGRLEMLSGLFQGQILCFPHFAHCFWRLDFVTSGLLSACNAAGCADEPIVGIAVRPALAQIHLCNEHAQDRIAVPGGPLKKFAKFLGAYTNMPSIIMRPQKGTTPGVATCSQVATPTSEVLPDFETFARHKWDEMAAAVDARTELERQMMYWLINTKYSVTMASLQSNIDKHMRELYKALGGKLK